jgi:hypothetical protein
MSNEQIELLKYQGIRVETFGEWQIRQFGANLKARAEELESTIALDTKLLQLKYDSLYPAKPTPLQRFRSCLKSLRNAFKHHK